MFTTHTDRPRTSSLRTRGFSIIELMVAVTLSLLLLGGVATIFSSTRDSYETTDRMSRIQENGRYAIEQITRQIRAAGFVGCARQPTYVSTSLNNSTDLQWNFLGGPVRGYQSTGAGAWSPALDASVISPASGSDVLVLRVPARDAEPMRLTTTMTSATADLLVPSVTTGVRTGDVALAYNCEAHSYFYVSDFTAGVIQHAQTAAAPGNAVATLNYPYRDRVTHVIPVETVIYYIRDSTAATLPAGTRSLWRRVGLNAAEELIEGVEQLQLRFGVDTNGDVIVDVYQTANDVANWTEVISVEVAVLIRSIDGYGSGTDNRSYQLLDVTVPAVADSRIRGVFTATSTIRNRVRVN
jgi:type IV pilus assembly protein PilW